MAIYGNFRCIRGGLFAVSRHLVSARENYSVIKERSGHRILCFFPDPFTEKNHTPYFIFSERVKGGQKNTVRFNGHNLRPSLCILRRVLGEMYIMIFRPESAVIGALYYVAVFVDGVTM